jgi:hypothetical protein
MYDCVFVEPLCYGNAIYMNKSIGVIDNCDFKGRNGSFVDYSVVEKENIP